MKVKKVIALAGVMLAPSGAALGVAYLHNGLPPGAAADPNSLSTPDFAGQVMSPCSSDQLAGGQSTLEAINLKPVRGERPVIRIADGQLYGDCVKQSVVGSPRAAQVIALATHQTPSDVAQMFGGRLGGLDVAPGTPPFAYLTPVQVAVLDNSANALANRCGQDEKNILGSDILLKGGSQMLPLTSACITKNAKNAQEKLAANGVAGQYAQYWLDMGIAEQGS